MLLWHIWTWTTHISLIYIALIDSIVVVWKATYKLLEIGVILRWYTITHICISEWWWILALVIWALTTEILEISVLLICLTITLTLALVIWIHAGVVSWNYVWNSLTSKLWRLEVRCLLAITHISILLLQLLSPLILELNVLIILDTLSVELLPSSLGLNILLLLTWSSLILPRSWISVYQFIHLLELNISRIIFIISCHSILIFCLVLSISFVFIFITVWITHIVIIIVIIWIFNLIDEPWTNLLISDSSESIPCSCWYISQMFIMSLILILIIIL